MRLADLRNERSVRAQPGDFGAAFNALVAQHLNVAGTKQPHDSPKTHPFEAGSIHQITDRCDDGRISQHMAQRQPGLNVF
ncbi:hypothetical protein [Tateyamaria sp. ANG-S1]|uniref:hypothetical protein n=1 Tax=Tateyamaria sp. ANG-S1 TaxID=1577905 RepID=UPI00187BF2A0|nr:hypothetical protein [Tateyamaria sp. ANG-S1]